MHSRSICPPALATLLAGLCACGSGVAVQGAGSAAALSVASAPAIAAPQATPAPSASGAPAAVGQVCMVPLGGESGATESCPHCAP